MDSFLIVPDFSKATFALKTGSQTDRLTGSVPLIEISGVEIETYKDLAFRAPHASLNIELSVFRDKRFPLSAVRIKTLPSQILNNLPFKFQVDTLKLLESSIVYEEYPSDSNESGIVSFKGLTALVTNASNMSHENMVMHARARFMNAGDLTADLTFPPNPRAPYTAKGSLSNFNLPDINPMLIPAARTEIKVGWLKSLTFEFVYNDYRADGLLTMNYTNLEVISLTKHLGNRSTNKLMTMILQAFVLKKDMDKNKRQGTILFYRDSHRSVFNYWWKSILSGIQSLYNLDRIMDTHHNKSDQPRETGPGPAFLLQVL